MRKWRGTFRLLLSPTFGTRPRASFQCDPFQISCLVLQIAKHSDTLLVMCRSGGRSALAVELLTRAGFSNVYNISDGMEGDLVTDTNSVFRGQRMVNGWKNSGLPWTYDVDPKRMVLPPNPGQ